MQIILDTDMDTDCDDAGALAVLHALAWQGKAEILGVICSAPVPWASSCIRAINAWYERPEIPVAGLTESDWSPRELAGYLALREPYLDRGRLYNEVVGPEWARDHPEPSQLSPMRLYRQLLASAPGQGVTICTIGFMTALAALLASEADDISPLTGIELVSSKVKSLVMEVTALFPAGKDVFNWKMDLPCAAAVLRLWPRTPIVVSPLVFGGVYTGGRFMATAPVDHPVRRAYHINLGGSSDDHHSADLLAVLYAVQGADPFFHEHKGFDLLLVDEDSGRHEWRPSQGDRDHTFLSLALEAQVVAAGLEELLCAARHP